MAKDLNYLALYDLQDRVLNIVKELENDFYLTGGTALHRFYYNARYSDDLDFFVTNGVTFNEDATEVIQLLKEKNFKVTTQVSSRDFYRVFIDDLLQIDFVNDRVYRYRKSNIINGIKIDNKLNILTNKINTIINRDEEKDIFDLFCLAYNESFNWKEILEIANKKAVIQKDILIYRLKSFPLEWLKRIKQIEEVIISRKGIEQFCDDILDESDNSLVIKNR